VPERTLRKWCARLGLIDHLRLGETAQPPTLDQRAKAQGYANLEALIRETLLGHRPLADVAQIIGAHPKSLVRYIPPELKGNHTSPTPRRLAYYERLRRQNHDRYHQSSREAHVADQAAERKG
jgi:hypothetical protein